MAIVKRQSGSYKAVTQALGKKGIRIENLFDLPKLLDTYKQNHAEATSVFEREQDELEKSFKTALERLFIEYEKLNKAILNKYDSKLKTLDEKLEIVRKQEREFNNKSFLFRVIHFKESIIFQGTNSRLQKQIKKINLEKEIKFKEQKKDYDDKVQKISKKKDDYRYEIEKKVKSAQEKMTSIDDALKSGTYYGACAELKMIDFLNKLPDNYYVINDANLTLRKSVRFDGAWLSSAQIDHLVIGPAGVFVVEVKNWSKKFISDGEYFDPYQQVKRHNYVCYTLLNRIEKTTVRSIVACAGYLPDKPDSSHAKVLSLEQVNGYILWFKEIKHDPAAVLRMVQFIEREIEYTQ